MFDANGTEGLELFTWVVSFLLALVGALVTAHAIAVSRQEKEEKVEEAHEEHHHKSNV